MFVLSTQSPYFDYSTEGDPVQVLTVGGFVFSSDPRVQVFVQERGPCSQPNHIDICRYHPVLQSRSRSEPGLAGACSGTTLEETGERNSE